MRNTLLHPRTEGQELSSMGCKRVALYLLSAKEAHLTRTRRHCAPELKLQLFPKPLTGKRWLYSSGRQHQVSETSLSR